MRVPKCWKIIDISQLFQANIKTNRVVQPIDLVKDPPNHWLGLNVGNYGNLKELGNVPWKGQERPMNKGYSEKETQEEDTKSGWLLGTEGLKTAPTGKSPNWFHNFNFVIVEGTSFLIR